MLSNAKYVLFDNVLPAISRQQQQGGLAWWAWFIIIGLVILFFVLLWSRLGLSRGGEQPAAPDAPVVVEANLQAHPVAMTPVKPDDLTLIEGIGPKIEGVLQGAGINTFAQLADTDLAALETTLKAAGLRLADPESWAEQARLAAEGKLDELKILQDRLKGGRRA